jgi:hypothetical protein
MRLIMAYLSATPGTATSGQTRIATANRVRRDVSEKNLAYVFGPGRISRGDGAAPAVERADASAGSPAWRNKKRPQPHRSATEGVPRNAHDLRESLVLSLFI